MLVCPECRSRKVWKDGLRYVQDQPVQRFLCRDCGFRFSDPSFSMKNTIYSVGQTGSCQICVTKTKVAKNLTAEAKNKALQENRKNTKNQLVNFSLQLLRDGKSESTIKTYTKLLKLIKEHADLNDPEAVKSVIATKFKDRNTKRLIVCAYDSYIKFVCGKWKKPNYKPEHKQVFIPTEKELQLAMNTGTKENIVFQKLLFETGARENEAERVEWTDLNKERLFVSVKSSKNGDSRYIEISENLVDLINRLPRTNGEFVFRKRPRNSRACSFHHRMKRLAEKHNNPRFPKIHLHTFRHCKALREYHKTRDILHVMAILGHRNINTTYRYVRLYTQIYKPKQKFQYVTKIAATKEERIELINNNWELVSKDGEDWYFRKPE